MHYWQLIALPAAIGVGLLLFALLMGLFAAPFKEDGKVDNALLNVATASVILAMVAGAALFVCSIVAVSEAGVRHGCISKAQAIGVDGKYKAFGGCFLEKDGQWIPDGNWVHNDGN